MAGPTTEAVERITGCKKAEELKSSAADSAQQAKPAS